MIPRQPMPTPTVKVQKEFLVELSEVLEDISFTDDGTAQATIVVGLDGAKSLGQIRTFVRKLREALGVFKEDMPMALKMQITQADTLGREIQEKLGAKREAKEKIATADKRIVDPSGRPTRSVEKPDTPPGNPEEAA